MELVSVSEIKTVSILNPLKTGNFDDKTLQPCVYGTFFIISNEETFLKFFSSNSELLENIEIVNHTIVCYRYQMVNT